jgi:hypothetical protein
MARIKIKDLPKDTFISKEEMKKVLGGNPLFTGFLDTPWILGGTIATAIAIPVALHTDDDVAS